jgi:hypothetical protein
MYGKNYQVPPEGILDYLSRRDELQIRTNQLLEQLISLQSGNPVLDNAVNPFVNPNQQDLKNVLESNQFIPYAAKSFDMTTAQTDYPVTVEGNNLVAMSTGAITGVTVKFNNTNNDSLPLAYFKGRTIQFTKLYLTWSAQPAKTLYLAIGRSDTEFDLTGYGIAGSATGKQTLFNQAFGVTPAGTYYTSWLNLTTAKRACLFITNTLDQPVTIQLIGQIEPLALPGNYATIGLPSLLPAATGIWSPNITDAYWNPYIGCVITQPGAVTVGSLLIEAVAQ